MRRFRIPVLLLLIALGLLLWQRPGSAATSVTGRVTLPDGTTGVGSAWVTIHDASWSVYQGTNTSSNGGFSFYDLSTCTCVLEVYANNANYADPDARSVSVTAGTLLDLDTVRLTSHNIIGTLKAPDGVTSVSGHYVSLENTSYTIYRSYQTNSSGQFRFRVPETGTYKVRIWSDYVSGNTRYYAPPETTITVTNTSETLDVGSIVMKNPNVTGTVTESNGTTGVNNASVYAHTANWSISKWSSTASNGSFGFYLPSGTYYLDVYDWNDSGNNPAQSTFTVTEGENVSLGAIRKLSPNVFFKVTQSDGTTAVNNASINVHTANWNNSKYATTNASGTASVALATAGTYTVEIWSPISTEFGPDPFTITFTSGTTYYYDGTNGSSVLKLQVSSLKGIVKRGDGTLVQSASITMSNAAASVYKWAYTDQNGLFIVPPVATGTYTLEVTPPYDSQGLVGPDNMTVSLTKGVTDTTYQTTPIVLTTAQKTITGRVTKPDGTVITNGTINAWKTQGSGWATTTTNSSGEFTLRVGSGNWNVTVYPTTWNNSEWNYFGSPVLVQFTQANSVAESGTANFTVDAYTATIAGTVLNPNDTVPSGITTVSVWKQQGGWGSSVLDSQGNFSIRVAPGTYNMNLYNPNNTTYASPDIAPITVKDGETKNIGTIKFVEKKEFINGQVSDSKGRAIASQSVSCWKQRGSGYVWGSTDSNGQYTLNVSPGTWTCDSWPSWYGYGEGDGQTRYARTQEPQEVTVNANETKNNINFVFSIIDAKINGVIKNESGTVLTDVYGWVQATKTGSDSGSIQYSNLGGEVQGGNFTVHVPAGTYNLGMWMPYGSGYTARSETSVTVGEGGTVNDAVITMVPNNVTLQGTLRDSAGNAVTTVSGSIYATNGTTGSQWATISNGSYSMKLSAGVWRIGYWIDPRTGYVNQPPDENSKLTLTANETRTFDITLVKLDSTISGRVLNPSGNPLPNALIAVDTEMGGKKAASSAYDMWGGMFNRDNFSDSDGNFSIAVPAGKYFVSATVPSSFGYISPKVQEVEVSPTSPATLSYQFRQPDATISGRVTMGHTTSFMEFRALNHEPTPAYVSAWSNHGGFVEQFTNTGDFILNVTKEDEWHLKAVYETAGTVYKSQEHVITVGASGTATQNLEMFNAAITLPAPVTATFPSNVTKVLELEDGMAVTMPANSLTTSNVDVTVTVTPDAQLPNQANDNVVSFGYDLEATYASGDSNGQSIASFPQDVTITLPYDEDAIEDDDISEDALEPKYWDTTAGAWRTVENTVVNKESDEIVFTTDHFTSYGLVTSTSSSVSPTITVTSPTDGDLARKNNLTVTGSVTDANATTTMTVNGGTAKSVTLASNGTFSTVITTLSVGTNTITVNATNGAGAAKAVTRTVTYSRAGHLSGANRIVITPAGNGGPQVILADRDGTIRARFFAYPKTQRMGITTLVSDLNDDGTEEIITVPGAGFSPHIRIFDLRGNLLGSFFAYGKGFRKGINVVAADTNGDGLKELVTVPQTGGIPQVRIFDFHGKLIGTFFADARDFRGGMNIVSGDLDGDREAELLFTSQSAGDPTVRIFDGKGRLLGAFALFSKTLKGNFTVLTVDTDGDDDDEIVTVPGRGMGPQIRVFQGNGTLLTSFFALPTKFRGGLGVSAGDLTGDGAEEMVVTPLGEGGPQVRVFNAKGTLVSTFFGYAATHRGSFSATTTDLDADGTAEIILAPLGGFGPHVQIYNSKARLISSFFPFAKTFRGGINVSVNDER